MEQDSSASKSVRDSRTPPEPSASSESPPTRATRIAARLPRPETTCLLLSLICTIGAKLVAVRRHHPEDLLTAWLTVISPDLPFFTASIALVSVGYGLANLGYLLLGAGIIFGSFPILGLRSRRRTFAVAVAAWLVGIVLSNV